VWDLLGIVHTVQGVDVKRFTLKKRERASEKNMFTEYLKNGCLSRREKRNGKQTWERISKALSNPH
jgi:hypothetical protein